MHYYCLEQMCTLGELHNYCYARVSEIRTSLIISAWCKAVSRYPLNFGTLCTKPPEKWYPGVPNHPDKRLQDKLIHLVASLCLLLCYLWWRQETMSPHGRSPCFRSCSSFVCYIYNMYIIPTMSHSGAYTSLGVNGMFFTTSTEGSSTCTEYCYYM